MSYGPGGTLNFTDIARLCGPATVLVSWLIGFYLFYIVKTPNNATISHVAATNRASYIRFGIALTIMGALLSIFGLGWIVPTYELGVAGDVLFGLIFAAFFINAWIPVGRSNFQHIVHRFGGYGLSALMLVLTVTLTLNSRIDPDSHRIGAIATLVMVLIVLYFVVNAVAATKKLERYFLAAELIYVLSAEMLLLAVSIMA